MILTDYKQRFDHHLPGAISAVSNLAPDIEEEAPGLTSKKIHRLLTSISNLLGRIDKNGAKFPEYLAFTGEILPERAISLVQAVPGAAANGPSFFVTNFLPNLVDLEFRLIRAIGVGAYTLQDIKSLQVIELQSILQSAQDGLAKVQTARKAIAEQQTQLNASLLDLQKRRAAAEESLEFIERTRQTAAKLASGDARGGNSLERIVRTAREKNAELEKLMADASAAKDTITAAEREAGSLLLSSSDMNARY